MRFFFSFLLFILLALHLSAQEKRPVILDADTGNEVDDLYAIVRALLEPTWDVKVLNATHWQTSHWTVPQSMEESHRLNQLILGYLPELSVKTRRGGIARMYDWGDLAQHSAAAYEIIHLANSMPAGEKITVIALGALTNVASAYYINPDIAEKITLYWLGTAYDFTNSALSRVDFNVMMDQRAFDLLIKSDMEMHIIPVNVATAMTFNYAETEKKLRGIHPLTDFLVDRWYQHLDGSRDERTIWDLGLIGAIIHPEWSEEIEITTSPDHGNRSVYYYKEIDGEKIKTEFFDHVKKYWSP